MNYKVGDKVKVRQDLVNNSAYGAHKWYFGMYCKYIVINRVWDNCYVAQNNGTNWHYTDEMLDGLADEPEEEPEKPTDAELIQAAELLKANCKNQKDCHKCIFLSKVCCKFEYKTPEEWELLHRKTRKEVLLEKFPNIKVDACGIPCLNPCEMDPIYSNNNCLRKWEHDCVSCRKGYWNVPAESEEE